jgi:hypothetical protein
VCTLIWGIDHLTLHSWRYEPSWAGVEWTETQHRAPLPVALEPAAVVGPTKWFDWLVVVEAPWERSLDQTPRSAAELLDAYFLPWSSLNLCFR